MTHKFPVPQQEGGALGLREGLLYHHTRVNTNRFWIPHVDPEEPPIPLFQKRGDYVLLPWNSGHLGASQHDHRHTTGAAYPVSSFKPRHEDQERVLAACVKKLTAGMSFVALAPTGWGKTVVGTQVAVQCGFRTLIVVTKTDIMKQWRDSIAMLLGKDYKVGVIQGDQVDVDADLVLTMVHSICKRDRYPDSVLDGFGLTIVDEVHRMGAETFAEAAWNMRSRLRLGWTATDWRTDGRDVVFEAHIGTTQVVAQQKAMGFQVIVVKTDFKLPRKKDKLTGQSYPMDHKPGKTGHISKMLAANVARNAAMVVCVLAAHKKGRQTIIFSDRLDHLKKLKWMLEAKGVLAKEIGMYVGGCKPDEIKERPILLATYTYCSEGTDIPGADTLVFGIPRANVIQIVGRILREKEGKKTPTVFDFLDEDSWVFCKYFEKRSAYYAQAKAPVKIVKAADIAYTSA